MTDFLYLASQSPRRSQLLDQLGWPHRLLLPEPGDPDAGQSEALEAVLPGESPRAYVRRVTRLKLAAAVERHARRGLPDAPILCSDTTVAVDRQILGKPADADDAARMLRLLAGRSHKVLTGVAIHAHGRVVEAVSESRVRMDALSERQIADYVATGEPLGKAGAYGIQGRAAAFIARIVGSYSGIMGLPLHETARLLASLRGMAPATGQPQATTPRT